MFYIRTEDNIYVVEDIDYKTEYTMDPIFPTSYDPSQAQVQVKKNTFEIYKCRTTEYNNSDRIEIREDEVIKGSHRIEDLFDKFVITYHQEKDRKFIIFREYNDFNTFMQEYIIYTTNTTNPITPPNVEILGFGATNENLGLAYIVKKLNNGSYNFTILDENILLEERVQYVY